MAFFNGQLVKTGKLEVNRLKTVSRLDESRDRRTVRRPLSDAEMARLFNVAESRGRLAWYACAAYAGLRKGDLQRLVWSDVDFDVNTITIREGKAHRTDIIPMHHDLAVILKARKDQALALSTAKVFPQTVGNRTRQKDFMRAGIDLVDDQGRVADLHALRTTLGTNLARAGTAPQVAQKIMRHSSYQTTLNHYTILGLTDTAQAVDQLPTIQRAQSEKLRATGTEDLIRTSTKHSIQQIQQQSEHISQPNAAKRCENPEHLIGSSNNLQSSSGAALNEEMRDNAYPNKAAGDRGRTSDIQLVKLDAILDSYNGTLEMQRRLGPLQEKMIRHLEQELKEADEANRWKENTFDEDEGEDNPSY